MSDLSRAMAEAYPGYLPDYVREKNEVSRIDPILTRITRETDLHAALRMAIESLEEERKATLGAVVMQSPEDAIARLQEQQLLLANLFTAITTDTRPEVEQVKSYIKGMRQARIEEIRMWLNEWGMGDS